ncbi:hypothetical protein [Loigolactobacillus backii]|uniref:hypothetical protein n=1 Tax=Loigolactobacillus backii TaxID=375175 RepID=UPI00177DBD47|nr:hypothetical protein [Loigolactobacillus backii]
MLVSRTVTSAFGVAVPTTSKPSVSLPTAELIATSGVSVDVLVLPLSPGVLSVGVALA